MKDYSQTGEQAHILRYFEGRTGHFLDLGANDGVTFSNTHALALLGWSGVCVDASPKAYEALRKTYKDRCDVWCLNYAIAERSGPITLHQASDTLVSSLNASQPMKWGRYGFQWEQVTVDGVTIEEMMQYAKGPFNFISMDIEGMDYDILRTMDLQAMCCELLCIEHDNRQAEILAHMNGWRIVFGGDINLILARP
jgi:FkbM family methyltransferase